MTNLDHLTDAQRSRIKECKTPEEMLALAREEGYELADDELELIAGGSFWNHQNSCPNCGSNDSHTEGTGTVNQVNVCNRCGCRWDPCA